MCAHLISFSILKYLDSLFTIKGQITISPRKYSPFIISDLIGKDNKLAWIKDQKQSVKEFKNEKAPEFWEQVRPDGYSVDKEKWEMDISLLKKQADEYLEYLQKMEDSLE